MVLEGPPPNEQGRGPRGPRGHVHPAPAGPVLLDHTPGMQLPTILVLSSPKYGSSAAQTVSLGSSIQTCVVRYNL